MANQVEADETEGDFEEATVDGISKIAIENNKVKQHYLDIHSWHWLAKDIADYMNESVYVIYDKPAYDIAARWLTIHHRTIYNSL